MSADINIEGMTSKLTTEVLLGALTIIKQRGWIQHRSQTKEGFCMLGAINKSCEQLKSRGDYFTLSSAAITAVKKYLPEKMKYSIAHYNDAPERTIEEVTEVLERAINENTTKW